MLKFGKRLFNCANFLSYNIKNTFHRSLTSNSFNTKNVFPEESISIKNILSPVFIMQPRFYIPPQQSKIQPFKIDELPLYSNKIIDNPRHTLLNEINEIIRKHDITTPSVDRPSSMPQIIEKQATRLVVIRRRKMKKHKLRKLRKKMKFEWAKARQRREMRKEKAFQAELIAQIKEAEKFSAESYVAEKLRQANETPIPRFWKGKRLPQFIIKQKLGIK